MAKRDTTKPTSVDDLTTRQAKAEHDKLAVAIAAHDKRYYQEDAPSISDAEYDRLRQRYDAIEQRFPDLRSPESLSRKVGAAPSAKFAKVRHRVPMLSLANAFSAEDVTDFVERIRRFLRLGEDEPLAFAAEPKIDGLSLSLRYQDGLLVNARPAATAPKARTSLRTLGRWPTFPRSSRAGTCPPSARCAARST
jgi:DNA ligase (NAD+)